VEKLGKWNTTEPPYLLKTNCKIYRQRAKSSKGTFALRLRQGSEKAGTYKSRISAADIAHANAKGAEP